MIRITAILLDTLLLLACNDSRHRVRNEVQLRSAVQMRYPILLLSLACFLSGCDRRVSLETVNVLEKITHANNNFEYQYLSIPDSASLDTLRSITRQIMVRDERHGLNTVYNYYIGSERKKKFAVFCTYLVQGGDTVLTVQYGEQPNLLYTNVLEEINKFKQEKKYIVSDSCYGLWRNWLNPFNYETVLFRKDRKYFVETFSPGSTLLSSVTEATLESDGDRTFITHKRQEYVHFEAREKKTTDRYTLNEFGDLILSDQYGDEKEYMVGVYNFVCGCDKQQDIDELRKD